jgi:hypothetical protein
MTDFRALCAELLEAIEDDVIDTNDGPKFQAVVDRASAALAQPEPPSLKEQAIAVLEDAELDAAHYNILLRALEQLND